MSTDLKKKLGSFISLTGTVLTATPIIIGVPPSGVPGFEDIEAFVVLSGGFLILSGQIMRQRAGQCSEEDVEAEQEA